jgi:hypothetical protein
MTAIALCRKRQRLRHLFALGRWALETSDRERQDKARKVRAVGRDEMQLRISVIQQTFRKLPPNLRFSIASYCRSAFHTFGA